MNKLRRLEDLVGELVVRDRGIDEVALVRGNGARATLNRFIRIIFVIPEMIFMVGGYLGRVATSGGRGTRVLRGVLRLAHFELVVVDVAATEPAAERVILQKDEHTTNNDEFEESIYHLKP